MVVPQGFTQSARGVWMEFGRRGSGRTVSAPRDDKVCHLSPSQGVVISKNMRRASRVRVLLCLLPLAVPAGLVAQNAKKSTKQNESPRIRVTTRLVNVSVAVRDKHGEPATNLSRKDFTIYDGGRKQAIAFFRLPGTGPAATLPSATHPEVYSKVS